MAKKATTKKKAAAKKKVITKKKTTAKKAGSKTKVEQAVDILTEARKKDKNVARKDVIALIVKKMKCTEERAGGHYQAANTRLNS